MGFDLGLSAEDGPARKRLMFLRQSDPLGCDRRLMRPFFDLTTRMPYPHLSWPRGRFRLRAVYHWPKPWLGRRVAYDFEDGAKAPSFLRVRRGGRRPRRGWALGFARAAGLVRSGAAWRRRSGRVALCGDAQPRLAGRDRARRRRFRDFRDHAE